MPEIDEIKIENKIEILEKMDITNENANVEINRIAKTINAINAEAARKGDVELLKKENAELKSALEVNAADITALKAFKEVRFSAKSAEEKLETIGKFMMACRHNNLPVIKEMGGFIQANKHSEDDWKAGTWNINAAPDLGTPLRGDTATGSYLIPDELAREILRVPEDPSAMMNQVRTIPMTVRKISFPSKLAGTTWTWVTNEDTEKTETNPTFSTDDLVAKTAAAWIAFTEEFQEDNIIPQTAYFIELFREAWQKEFDTQCLNSDGAPFTGVLHASSTNVLNLGAGNTSFGSVDFDDMKDLVAKLDTQSKRNGARFIMHVTILDIFKGIKDDNGRYIWQEPAGSTPATIMGYNYILSDAMPDSGDSAASTAFIAFGNPKYIMHGDRVGLEFKIFDQTADALVNDRLFLRARTRKAFLTSIPSAWAIMKTAGS